MSDWNAGLYESAHSFVWQRGRGLVEMLAPRAGERILDAGCGTGQLTAELAQSGADVLGVDSSESMIEQARRNFPALAFRVADVRSPDFHEEFDAVFSNAVLHWVLEPEAAAGAISRALKTGGRFVAEFGGYGNTRAMLDAARGALDALGCAPVKPWYFPKVGEYSSVLEGQGLEVRHAALFDRPIRLEHGENGLAEWIEMFGGQFLAAAGEARKEHFLRSVEARGPGRHCSAMEHGRWITAVCA
jgi:trans-aconitate 2-methyltransferase